MPAAVTAATPAPKLLKKRCFHSRIFFVLMASLLLVSNSLFKAEGLLHEEFESIGCVLIGICILGRSYCSLFIGGRKNGVIVEEGPFSIVRNPLYVFSFLGMLGITLQTGMLTIILLCVLAFIIYYSKVVQGEENFLTHKFGDFYQAYQGRVPRWWPNLKLWQVPQYVEVQPRFVLLTMRDSLGFLLPFPVLEFLAWLHDQQILPYLFRLP